jgi:hypothetical protein
MAHEQKRRTSIGIVASIDIETWYRPEDSYLCGVLHGRKGWHWHLTVQTAMTFNGVPQSVSGVIQGPFNTEAEALADGISKLLGHEDLKEKDRQCA